MDYKNIKEKVIDNKPLLIYCACVLASFFIGLGVGKSLESKPQLNRDQYDNYNTLNAPKKVEETKAKEQPKPVLTATPTTANQASPQTCTKIKGNISSKSKIYHMPGGAFYEKTQPEQCFATEAEAQAAGFVKSKR